MERLLYSSSSTTFSANYPIHSRIHPKLYPILPLLGRVDSVKLTPLSRPESSPAISTSLTWKQAASSKPFDKFPPLCSHRAESSIESVDSPDVHIGGSGKRKVIDLGQIMVKVSIFVLPITDYTGIIPLYFYFFL